MTWYWWVLVVVVILLLIVALWAVLQRWPGPDRDRRAADVTNTDDNPTNTVLEQGYDPSQATKVIGMTAEPAADETVAGTAGGDQPKGSNLPSTAVQPPSTSSTDPVT